MVRELFHLKGKRHRVKTIGDALRIVRERYPGAVKQGALGTWSFYIPPAAKGRMVAEAWLSRGRGADWWLVVADSPKQL